MANSYRIVICGDICPTADTVHLFESGDISVFGDDLVNLFQKADFLIGNMEFPMTDQPNGIQKCGPVLYGKISCVKLFKNAGFHALGMANNHILDCGENGVLSTLAVCESENIQVVGAGKNALSAKKELLFDFGDRKVGVLAFAEHEFNAANPHHAGANIFDEYKSFEQMSDLKNRCDYLIVLYHGGIEHYAYPSPLLQKKCRKMVDSGADVVLCQHSHITGCEEKYSKGTILYGQGNTLFGKKNKPAGWNEGLLVEILLEWAPKNTMCDISANNVVIHYLPVHAMEHGTDIMPRNDAANFMRSFFERSKRIESEGFIINSWLKFCDSKKSLYYPLLYGWSVNLIRINRILKNRFIDFLYSAKRKRATMNLIRCDSHREVVQTLLENAVEEKF